MNWFKNIFKGIASIGDGMVSMFDWIGSTSVKYEPRYKSKFNQDYLKNYEDSIKEDAEKIRSDWKKIMDDIK